MLKFTKAVCRRVPRSIVNGGLRLEKEESPLNYEDAVNNLNSYIKTLESLGLKVTVLDADEELPDCVFVEDTAVIIGGTVLITRPGAIERQKEAEDMKKYFEEFEKKNIVEMKAPACLDGGDVMFTGHEIFVGESSRTNSEGIDTLRNAFPDYPVHPIKISAGLHLKSCMTMADENVIVCGNSPSASDALKQVLSKATKEYSVLRVPDDHAANVVLVNDTILCRSAEEISSSYKELEKLSIKKIQLKGNELAKVDGCHTCKSLLYN